MGARFLVLNYFNDRQYPSHILAASENTSDAWKVGAARRSPAHYWTASSANTQHWLKVDLGSVKSADMLVIDRVHNLGGVAGVKLQRSSDNFALDVVDVVTFTVPTSTSADNSALSSGVRTPEGAFLISFSATSSRYWRLLIPAVANFKPKIGGLWLGPSWKPPAINRPFGEDDHAPFAESQRTPWNWEGRTLVVPQRAGEIVIELLSEDEYLAVDEHIRDQYVRRPMWIVVDEAKAERAFLARWPLGVRAGFVMPEDYPYRRIRLPYEEHEPVVDDGALS